MCGSKKQLFFTYIDIILTVQLFFTWRNAYCEKKTVKIKWYNGAFILLERMSTVSNQLKHLGASTMQVIESVAIIISTCL